jgi:electron transfer flavoprotein alpha subunit
MSGVLVIAEHLDGVLRDVTGEAVTAAAELGLGGVAVAVLGRDPAAIAALVEERRPAAVVAGFTVSAMSWAPAVAAAHGLGFASDVVAARVDGDEIVAMREFYGGKVHGELTFPGTETVLLLVRPTAWQPAASAGAPRVTTGAPAESDARERHLDYVAPPAGDIDISSAEVILAIGRGVGEKENVAQFEELADRLGVTLAASRPLVDAGWLPAARQVGQSGKTVKPKVYVAMGISGAVQHLAGMKAATTIVAVNTDPDAAIFQAAHYGAVVDMFDVVEELRETA